MPNRIQLRRGNAQDWTNANPVLAEGEICVELDTEKFKIGNGILNWNNLEYSSGPIGPSGTITIGTVAVSTATTVINVGTPENAVLNFTVQPGPQGDTGTQINKLIEIPDINSTGLATGSMLIYDGVRTRWNTEKDLPITSNIDAGEF
jgi:hypothetical protein